MESQGKTSSPLSPAALQILAALAVENLHGYGIIQAVCAQSQGTVRIGPGTLYDNLKRFMDQGWVRDLKPASENDKRMYRLTTAGKIVLSGEIRRLISARYLPVSTAHEGLSAWAACMRNQRRAPRLSFAGCSRAMSAHLRRPSCQASQRANWRHGTSKWRAFGLP
jgi:DNA-binding PadR family transcriptional regulator